MEVFLDKLSQMVLIRVMEDVGCQQHPYLCQCGNPLGDDRTILEAVSKLLHETARCTFRFQFAYINGGYLYAVKKTKR